ncbi:hypothetical protein AB9P05_24440 [Roseivirga sp. BDSF3-8]|uniref:hypothetical protein n=1 Tax=Roseivirga sp. BDSF3-8 TaxID=3241598 RepID=UPI003532206A
MPKRETAGSNVIKSRYNLLFIGFILIVAILFIGLGTLLITISFGEKGITIAALPALLCLVMGLYVFAMYHNNLLSVRMDNEGIYAGRLIPRTFVPWQNVADIALFHDTLRTDALNGPACRVTLKDNKHLILYKKYYRNYPVLLQALHAVIELRKRKKPVDLLYRDKPAPKPVKHADMTDAERFGASFLSSGPGVWVLVNLVAWDPAILIFSTVFCLCLSLLFLFDTQYVYLSREYLAVSSYINPFYKRVYRLQDIRGVINEQPRIRAKGIRIVLSDFRMPLHCSSVMKDEAWQELTSRFRQYKVKVFR